MFSHFISIHNTNILTLGRLFRKIREITISENNMLRFTLVEKISKF